MQPQTPSTSGRILQQHLLNFADKMQEWTSRLAVTATATPTQAAYYESNALKSRSQFTIYRDFQQKQQLQAHSSCKPINQSIASFNQQFKDIVCSGAG